MFQVHKSNYISSVNLLAFNLVKPTNIAKNDSVDVLVNERNFILQWVKP